MILKALDIIRSGIVAATFFFGYRIGFANGYDPMAQLHFMVPLIVTAIAGVSGLEGLLFAKKSAEIKGFETGSNYQFIFFFSGVNHAADAIKRKNYAWQNINRPFITLLVIAGMIYPVVMALKLI